ncbi:MAG: hypothetical protein ABFS32_07380 [Bacteroidota bacterium]
MKKYVISLVILIFSFNTMAQDNQTNNLPYEQIPEYPESYTATNVVARMIDGLGFRYYWATEGLRPDDLAFKPNEEARTSEETIDHILGLTEVILNSVLKRPNDGSFSSKGMSFEQKRAKTLNNLKQASGILRSSDADLEEFTIIFKRGEKTSEYPFWNQINGPIADALWHVGQVVSFRRSSGNPYNSKASVFTGKLRN